MSKKTVELKSKKKIDLKEMTIDEVKTLITYSDIDHHKWDGYDWKWGEKLFKD